MQGLPRITSLSLCFCALLLTSCDEEFQSPGTSSTLGASHSRPTSSTSTPTAHAPVQEALSRHDVALRFLTAFIRLDRNMALLYATPEAVSKLNWNMSHRGNIPYYDDKMLLQFNGGWARVYFQDVGGTYRITNFDVHRR